LSSTYRYINQIKYKPGISCKVFSTILAFLIILQFGGLLFDFKIANAEVQKTDIVGTDTMENRGIAATDMPSIDAKYAYVADSEGNIYFERNALEPTQIASITKVMTALVAIESANLQTEITVSSNAASVGESSAGLHTGDTLTLAEALKALMIPSGNDAAIAIAETIGKTFLDSTTSADLTSTQDAQDQNVLDDTAQQDDIDELALNAFVAKMNETAAALGCQDSTFTNPHGLDEDEFEGDLHSCAADVYKIARKAMSYVEFSSIVKCESATIDITRDGEPTELELTSTDELLGVVEGMCGIKTGFTDKAGPCFAGACERDGLMLYVIVLNSSSETARFTDCETLIEWVFDNMQAYQLANSDVYTINSYGQSVPVIARISLNSWIDKTVDATFPTEDETIQVFRLFGNVSQSIEFYNVEGEVVAGQQVGIARFYQQNKLIAERALIATTDVAAPSLFEGIGIWWDKIIRGWKGEPASATSQVINTTPLLYSK
jgi:D-alanyl-D-alanine carboxypeptidase (penicillin-binding protein 5/6)